MVAMQWLFKEEPSNYSYDDLARDGKTSWTGVRNPLAQKHLRAVKKGDRIFFYHTGDVKAVVGIAKAAGAACGSADKTGKLYAVDVEPVKKLKNPVTLAAIKAGQVLRIVRAGPHVAPVGHARRRRAVGADRRHELVIRYSVFGVRCSVFGGVRYSVFGIRYPVLGRQALQGRPRTVNSD